MVPSGRLYSSYKYAAIDIYIRKLQNTYQSNVIMSPKLHLPSQTLFFGDFKLMEQRDYISLFVLFRLEWVCL